MGLAYCSQTSAGDCCFLKKSWPLFDQRRSAPNAHHLLSRAGSGSMQGLVYKIPRLPPALLKPPLLAIRKGSHVKFTSELVLMRFFSSRCLSLPLQQKEGMSSLWQEAPFQTLIIYSNWLWSVILAKRISSSLFCLLLCRLMPLCMGLWLQLQTRKSSNSHFVLS